MDLFFKVFQVICVKLYNFKTFGLMWVAQKWIKAWTLEPPLSPTAALHTCPWRHTWPRCRRASWGCDTTRSPLASLRSSRSCVAGSAPHRTRSSFRRLRRQCPAPWCTFRQYLRGQCAMTRWSSSPDRSWRACCRCTVPVRARSRFPGPGVDTY